MPHGLPRRCTRRSFQGFALVLAAASLIGASSIGAEPITLDDLARIESVTDVAIAPDATHIAYLLSVPRDPRGGEDGPAWVELHVVGPDGSPRPFITGEVNISEIDWTPDSRGISYVAKRSDDEDAVSALYVIPRDGGESKNIAELGGGVDDYWFHPDGDRVLVLSTPKDSDAREELRDKGFTQEIVEEEWRAPEAWIVRVDGAGKPESFPLEGSASKIHWSPTGDRIVYASAPTPLIDDEYMQRRIRIVDAESGEIVGRIENPGKLGDVAWSRDGASIAFISAIDQHDPKEGRLMVAPATGGTAVELLPGYEGHFEHVGWTSEGSIVYVASEGVEKVLGAIAPDGTGQRELAPRSAVWNELSVAPDGTVALVGETPSHPGEVFHWSADDGLVRLTRSNEWLRGRERGAQEVVRWTARDGLELEGILIRPVGEEAGTRYPLVVIVHGGPEAHISHGWLTTYSRQGQVLAGRGFAAFYPNYRGSTGRGVAFAKSSQGDPAGKEFDDIVDGVDHLIEVGLADGDRVGITGASYGGYATAWGATYYSSRYAAAVMSVGISNEISKFGTSDIPNELMLVHALSWPWDNWQQSLERSPIYHVDKARTPLLILHGKDDPRVFRGQSMELYRFLKIRGQAPVRLVLYPKEGHGNRRAASRYDYSLRALRWMEHYLKGPGGDPPHHELDYGFDDDATAGVVGENTAGVGGENTAGAAGEDTADAAGDDGA